MHLLEEERLEKHWYTDCIGCMYALMMLGILAICLLLPQIAYAKKWDAAPNWLLLPAAAAVFAMCVPLLRAVRLDQRRGRLILACLLAGILQVFMVSQYYFYTDWDVDTIVGCALAMIDGQDISTASNYFSMYQNNLVLVTLFGMVARFADWIGMAEHAYFAILVFQCLINWGTGMLLSDLVRRVSGSDSAAATAGVLYVILIGLSPWVSIPYSDSVALFFPTAILAVYTVMSREGRSGILRLFLMMFLSCFGYRIKPQVLIVLIAIGLLAAAEVVGKRVRRHSKTMVKRALACIAGWMCAALLCNTMAAAVDVEIDRNKTFGISHFLMMGLNTEEFGAYYQRDVSNSWWMETQEERTQMNLRVAAERVKEMGPVGLAQLFIRKTLTNYNDGTFCWGGEGIFYKEIPEERNTVFSPLLRNLYYGPKEIYQGEYGKEYGIWQSTAQAAWLLVLLLSVVGAADRSHRTVSVAMLALIGLTIFETVFEARARYLYCYAPLYILLAAMGTGRICAYKKRDAFQSRKAWSFR